MYAMLCTKLYVEFAPSVTSIFQANSCERQSEVVKCILKYLRRTKDLFLVYGREELKLHDYIEYIFQLDLYDSRSIFEFLFTLNGGTMS